jgi:hypothetical protein
MVNPPSWTDNEWLFRTVVDPTFVPALFLIIGTISGSTRLLLGFTVRFRYSLSDLLLIGLLLSVGLGCLHFLRESLPQIL